MESVEAKAKRKEYMKKYRELHKEEGVEYNQMYYQKNKDELRVQQKHYVETHVEQIREAEKVWHEAHREQQAEYHKNYYAVNKVAILAWMQQYNEIHKDERKAYMDQWCLDHPHYSQQHRIEHPDTVWRHEHKRRALVANADGEFSYEQFILKCSEYECRCIYCGNELPLVPDHMIPLSRGGSNSIENIIPACNSCNCQKQARTFEEYLATLSKNVVETIRVRIYLVEHPEVVQECLSESI